MNSPSRGVDSPRRGACPSLVQPMPTGDGLLARLMPHAPLTLPAFAGLCEASLAQGNGVVEVTQRGSLQIRGLSSLSAPGFARTMISLGIAEQGGPRILASPLMGLDAQERMDLRALVAELRALVSHQAALTSLSPKVSVLIDGGGTLHLDHIPGDVRLRAVSPARWHIGIGGTAADALTLGWVEPSHALEVIVHLLGTVASRGPTARGHDFANRVDSLALRKSLASVVDDAPPPPVRPKADPIGVHALNSGQVAVGVALAFGYADARALQRFAHIAARFGATSIQAAPGRALLAIGLEVSACEAFAAAVAAAGFITQPGDVRRQVIACAGAPACGSATLSTRRWAPLIAEAAAPFLDGSATIHVSGCAKGCAHPGMAAFTLIGPDRVVIEGRSGDPPDATLAPPAFIAGLGRLQRERRLEDSEEPSADMLSRLGKARVLELMTDETPP